MCSNSHTAQVNQIEFLNYNTVKFEWFREILFEKVGNWVMG